MIVGISGKIGSGKDTVGKIIQWLIDQDGSITLGGESFGENTIEDCVDFIKSDDALNYPEETSWQIKKFADKLKDMVCLLLGCTREQLEDREFKEKELGEEWDKIFYTIAEGKSIYDDGEPSITKIEKLTPRKLLQLLGTECGRQIIHPNIWVNALMSEYQSSNRENTLPNWIITDVRFPNEAQAIKDKGGINIRINRKSVTPNMPNEWYNGLEKQNMLSKSGELSQMNSHPSETALDTFENWDFVIDNNGTIEELIEQVKDFLTHYELI